MSAQPPQALEGTQAPSQIEFLWERYRPLFWTVLVAILVAMGGNYGYKYYQQGKVDQSWSNFSTLVGLDRVYREEPRYLGMGLADGLAVVDALQTIDLASLERGLAGASEEQRPFVLLAIARKAMLETNWDRAESALSDLESKYPNHSLVKTSDYPMQTRQLLDPKAKPAQGKTPELVPAVAGSAVARIRDQIKASRTYAAPAQFARIEPPATAKKVRFEFSNGRSFVIALMSEHAPKHCEAFLEFASRENGYWTGMAIDEIQRTTKTMHQAREMHLGFATTREDDRTKWITTEPSEKPLDFEASALSHFPGAVSGRSEADGKSCADRFWIVGDDATQHDGDRVIFGYVVDGLDAVKAICDDSSLSVQDEQMGRGRPTENIRVTAVKVLE